jgi:hypothetical protein
LNRDILDLNSYGDNRQSQPLHRLWRGVEVVLSIETTSGMERTRWFFLKLLRLRWMHAATAISKLGLSLSGGGYRAMNELVG